MSQEEKNLYQRILAVMDEVEYLQKDGEVKISSSRSYNYISETKVTSTLRESMIKHGIVILPTSVEIHSKNNDILTLATGYDLFNVDDPEDFIHIESVGEGKDTQDKGAGKAMTYAFKYALLRTFMIPSGEDPDQVGSHVHDENDKKKDQEIKTQPSPKPDNNAGVGLGTPPKDAKLKKAGADIPDLDYRLLNDVNPVNLEGITIEADGKEWFCFRLGKGKKLDGDGEWKRYTRELQKIGFEAEKLGIGWVWFYTKDPNTKLAPEPEPEPEQPAEPVESKDELGDRKNPWDGETEINGKDGTKLAVMTTKGQVIDIKIVADRPLPIDTAPFESFLIERVLRAMSKSDKDNKEINTSVMWTVEAPNDILESLRIVDYGPERRHRELVSSIRWTLEKMIEELDK